MTHFFAWLIATGLCFTLAGYAIAGVKGNEPLYQDPFDLAAGGAMLTRATGDGVIYANPALMPWGKDIFRYAGLMPSGWSTSESMGLAQGYTQLSEEEVFEKVFDTPMHVGAANSLGVVLRNFASSIVTLAEVDLDATRHGSDAGGPTVDVMGKAYGAFAMSGAARPEGSKWFSFGMTAKYITKTEPEISIPLVDKEQLSALANDPSSIEQEINPGSGFGFDFGMLLFAQGSTWDYRLALKADDIGGISFSGDQEPWKQTAHVGQGVTFHGEVHAIHLSLDYRDVANAYDDKPFRKVYAGAKLLLQNRLGFAVGLHHGIPSYGVRVDLFALKMGITRFGKELTNVIGEKRRSVIMSYVAIGW